MTTKWQTYCMVVSLRMGEKKENRGNFRKQDFSHIDGFTNEELRARYRFRRESIRYITNLLAEDLRRKTLRNHPLSVLQEVLIALRFYASGSFLRVVGDTVGVDKSTVSRVVTTVSLAFVTKQQQFIKWPNQQELRKSKKQKISRNFMR